MNARYALSGLLVCFTGLAGCGLLQPAWSKLTAQTDLESRWIETATFRHRVFSNRQDDPHLRIYVEGDGSPWLYGSRIAVDPTPSNPVLLRLMHRADHAAVYLGRPCYFGSATDSNCGSRWWTFDRYSRPVVESMCEAANLLIEERNASTVQLIGYSGGGAIVVGMATCTNRLIAITTIAGNLVPAAWTQHHGYTELRDLTLVETATLGRDNVLEVHWQCASDLVVPISITSEYFVARPDANRKIIEDCSHATGWERVWPDLEQLRPPGKRQSQ